MEDTTPFSSFFVISSDPDYILSGVLLDFRLFLCLCEDVIAEPSFALLDSCRFLEDFRCHGEDGFGCCDGKMLLFFGR